MKWLRPAVLLISVLLFINGCSSLTSRFFGTHKLRTYTAAQVLQQGIGDADYIRIEGVHLPGDYVYVPAGKRWGKAAILFPILATPPAETPAVPLMIGWTERFALNCHDRRSCVPEGQTYVEGLVRKPFRLKRRASELPTARYQVPDAPVYLEVNRQPTAWYWNLLMMFGGALLAYYIERRYQSRQAIDTT